MLLELSPFFAPYTLLYPVVVVEVVVVVVVVRDMLDFYPLQFLFYSDQKLIFKAVNKVLPRIKLYQ